GVAAEGSPAATAATAPPAVALPAQMPATPSPPPSNVAYPSAKFSYSFAAYSAGPFAITGPVLVTPGYQELYVRRGGETFDLYDGAVTGGKKVVATSAGFSALVTVYRPGAFQPTRFTSGEPVRVHGRPGFYAADVPYQPGESTSRGALAWQYADNAWATVASVTPDGYTKAEFLQIAEGLTTAPARTATTPVKLRWTPTGYVLTSAGSTDGYPNGASYMVSSVRLVKARPAYTGLVATVDASATGTATVRVSVYPIEFTDSTHQVPGAASCNAGNPNLCYRMTDDGKYLVEIDSNGGVPESDLRRVLDSAQLAQPADPSTWFPVTGAVPGAS
ncbi:hypothetical protein, partial [Dactylosporangium salmoneum]|uniref:hypothetical protein n=1 Tax=Dactylosporangium salmoneum TaxID=53361 RepID=UPI0031CFA20D